MKTLAMWHESKKTLNKFLEIGDEVDFALVAEQRDCVPPRTNTRTMVQTGEPNDNVRGRSTYTTFVLETKDGYLAWIYKGECHAGNDVHAEEFFDLEREGYHHLVLAQKAFAEGCNEKHFQAVTALMEKIRHQKL